MGKHSSGPANDGDASLPVFVPEQDEAHGSSIALRITSMPRDEGPGMLLINVNPFIHVQLGRREEEPEVAHVQVLYGGGLEEALDPSDPTKQLDTAELARYLREIAEMVEQGGVYAQEKTDAERAEDEAKWADFLSQASVEPSVDYSAGKAFATERVGKSAAQQDADDLALLGLDDEVVEATIEEDD